MRLFGQFADKWRWTYLAQAACGYLPAARWSCPNCGGVPGPVIGRKFVVTALVRCPGCQILYRAPTDASDFASGFYEREYSSGFTTDCPAAAELQAHKEARFRGTPKDFAPRIELLQSLGIQPGQRVLDFGASWGYATWQLIQAGYDAIGYEVSRSRARYARNMVGVPVHDTLEDLRGPFNAVFSSHVLEHVPRPDDVIRWAKSVLVPGGLFVALTPNGSDACRLKDAPGYHRRWGRVHPLYLNDDYYRQAFRGSPMLLASPPYDLRSLQNWNRRDNQTLELAGWELLVAAVN